jgi:hypothetical protein
MQNHRLSITIDATIREFQYNFFSARTSSATRRVFVVNIHFDSRKTELDQGESQILPMKVIPNAPIFCLSIFACSLTFVFELKIKLKQITCQTGVMNLVWNEMSGK